MTETEIITQIHKEANERYPMKGCRLEKQELRRLKRIFINKKMKEFGLIKAQTEVNS